MDFEREARRRKALTIVAWCQDLGFTADDVIACDGVIRDQMCHDAGVNKASAQTWELVVGLLGAHAAIDRMPPAMAAALPDDPFEGLS